ncbi:MAG: hypothetical protein CVV05_00300 [Gammaproteobacteria bacterium HGW-Gammaproteobacteria-1]|nr:MAG: hypothetical protein CVV05_00300 [Gammaproteobacteria bacterium HGW-Gammaproteobacteria-1]
MKPTTQQVLNFMAQRHLLLEMLFRATEAASEADILEYIRSTRPASDTTEGQTVFTRLREYGLIEPLADAQNRYEMTEPVRALLEHLLQSYRVMSSEAIGGYLGQLERYTERLGAAGRQNDSESVVLVLKNADALLERIRTDARNSCLAVMEKTTEIKSSLQSTPLRERYTQISHLWSTNIVPLEEVIDIHNAIEGVLSSLTATLTSLTRTFQTDSVITTRVTETWAKVRRMRTQTFTAYREAKLALEPLYRSIQREGMVAVGAARYLKLIEAKGITGFEQVAGAAAFLSHGRNEALFSDIDAKQFLAKATDYHPDHDITLAPPDETGVQNDDVGILQMLDWVHDAGDVSDLAEFLRTKIADFRATHFFDLALAALDSPEIEVQHGTEPTETVMGGQCWYGYPISVKLKEQIPR